MTCGSFGAVESWCEWRLWSDGAHAEVRHEQTRRDEGGGQAGVRVKRTLGKESPFPSL